MLLPVGRVDGCVGNRVAAVNHHAVADINANVTCTRGVISILEENQIAGRASLGRMIFVSEMSDNLVVIIL